MAHFAELDIFGNVLRVIVVGNETLGFREFPESEPYGQAFCKDICGAGTAWRQASYNRNFRGNYPGRGYRYDTDLDVFIPPKPYDSWTLSSITLDWEPPKPYPADGTDYMWDERQLDWVSVPLIAIP